MSRRVVLRLCSECGPGDDERCCRCRCRCRCHGRHMDDGPTSMLAAGFFLPSRGQVSCINCDDVGDFYQELPAQTSCRKCAANTQRYVGVLSAANKSACQCKEGAISATSPRWLACACVCARRFQRALPPQGTTTRDSRPARFVALAIDRCRALPAMRTRLASGFAGVCEMYEGARACAGCVAVGRAHASCLVWSRPCVREQVQSAFHVLAG